MVNLNLEKYGRMLINGTEVSEYRKGNDRFERAVSLETAKAALINFYNSRMATNLVEFNETRITSSTWASADKSKGFEISADVYNKVVGNSLGTNNNCFGAFVPCKKGESVSINFFNYEPYYGRCFYCEVDANFKVLTTPVQYSNGSSSVTQKTFTATNDNCIGLAIEWYLNANQTRNYTEENYMIVRGTTVPTSYYPHFSPATVLPHLKAFGAHSKHKAPKLWSQYVPAVASDTTAYPMTIENLVDISTAVLGDINSTTGAITTTVLYHATSDFISVEVGKTYKADSSLVATDGTVGTNSPIIIAEYDANKEFISGTRVAKSSQKFTITNASTAFVRCEFYCSNIGNSKTIDLAKSKTQLEVGETSHTIVPFGINKFVKNIGLDGTGTDFGYFNEESGEFVKVSGASGTVIQPVVSVTNGNSTSVDTNIKYNDNVELFIRCKAITGSFYILQSRNTGTGTIYGISGSQSGETINAFGVNSNIIRTAGHIYTIKATLSNRNVTLYVKDETAGVEDTKTGTADASNYPFPAPSTIKLFGDASKVASGVEVYDAYIKQGSEKIWECKPVRVGTQAYVLSESEWKLISQSSGSLTYGADIPYSQLENDIITVNTGDLQYGLYSANMFDKTAVKAGYYLNSSGAEVYNSAWNISDYMPVVGGETYYQTINTPGQSPRTCWYDENKIFISASEQHKGTQTAPVNAAYCRMCVWKDDADTAMFTHGADAPTAYEPYHFGIHTDGQHKLIVGEQGVVDLGTLSWSIVDGLFIGTVSDILAPSTSGDRNKGFVFSSLYSPDTQVAITGTAMHDMCALKRSEQIIIKNEAYETAAEFKSAMSGKYLFYQRSTDESYIPPIIRNIPTLYSEDSYCDTQLASNNVSEAWAVKVLDGTEDWSANGSAWRLYVYGGYDAEEGFFEVVCTHAEYTVKTLSTLIDGEISAYVYAAESGRCAFVLGKTADSLADFKAWLAEQYAKGTPVIILYPLATPAISSAAVESVALQTKATHTVTAEAELAVKSQATYLGKG